MITKLYTLQEVLDSNEQTKKIWCKKAYQKGWRTGLKKGIKIGQLAKVTKCPKTMSGKHLFVVKNIEMDETNRFSYLSIRKCYACGMIE